MQQVIDLITQKGFKSKGETIKWYGQWKPVCNVRKRFVYHSNHCKRVTVGKHTTYFYEVLKSRPFFISKFKTKDVESIKNFLSEGFSNY